MLVQKIVFSLDIINLVFKCTGCPSKKINKSDQWATDNPSSWLYKIKSITVAKFKYKYHWVIDAVLTCEDSVAYHTIFF